MTAPAVWVVVPAHDEAAVIGGAVRMLRHPAVAVTVIANGCTDDTAARAREAGAGVVEIDEASKIAAINAGLERAGTPVAVVDADVTVSGAVLVALAERAAARDAPTVAAPRLRVAPSPSWWVRQYYRVWELTDYRSRGHVGSGLYLLNAAAAARIGRLPDVIADDRYVQCRFGPGERLSADDLDFSVRAPATLTALIRRGTRIAAGNRQLAARYPALAGAPVAAGARTLLRRVLPHPSLWCGFVVYALVYLRMRGRAAALLARSAPVAWDRDETTRQAV